MITLNGDRLTAHRASHSRPGVVHALTINVVSGAVWCAETCAAQRRGLPHRHHRELRALLAGLTAIAARTGRPLAATVADLADTLTVQAGFSAETLAQQVAPGRPGATGLCHRGVAGRDMAHGATGRGTGSTGGGGIVTYLYVSERRSPWHLIPYDCPNDAIEPALCGRTPALIPGGVWPYTSTDLPTEDTPICRFCRHKMKGGVR